MRHWTLRLFVTLLLVGPSPARASEEASTADVGEAGDSGDTLAHMVASRAAVGSRRARPLYATPSTVSIIDRATIARFGFRTLGEALETVAGMQDLRTTSRTDVITSRGVTQDHYVNKVLLMIDGVAVWNPVVGEAKLSRVSLAEVERIEVLRGPASVLYGTNAYAGAINVVLRRLGEAGTSVSGTIGVGDAAETHGGVTALVRSGDWSGTFGASFQDETGPTETVTDAAIPPVTGQVREFRRATSVVGSLTWNDEHTLTVQAFRTSETKWGNDPLYVGGGLGDPLQYDGLLAVYQLRKQFSEAVTAFANVSYDYTSYLFSRGYGFNPRTDVAGWRLSATTGADTELTDWLTLELSGTGERRTSERYHSYSEAPSVTYVERDGNLHGKSVNEASVAAQLDFELFPFALLAGARATFNEKFGINLSPRATALWSFASGQSVKLIAGQSYRAPSLFEIYFLNSSPGAADRTLSGNPDLKPETATSIEAAYVGQTGGLSWQTLGYFARYEDKIGRVEVPVGTLFADGLPAGPDPTRIYRKYENLPGYDAYGAELELKYTSSLLDVFASYTWIETNASGPRYTPTYKIALGPAVTWHDVTLAAVANWWSATDSAASGGGTLGAQLLLDLNVSYTHALGSLVLRHGLAIKDLLDREVVVPDYVDRSLKSVIETPGRRLLYTLGVDL